MFCRSSFLLFLSVIVLSVLLRYTDSDYPFGIFKLFGERHLYFIERNVIVSLHVAVWLTDDTCHTTWYQHSLVECYLTSLTIILAIFQQLFLITSEWWWFHRSSVIIWYAFSRKVPTIHNYTYASRVVTCTCRLAVALFVIRFIASDYPSEHLNKLFFKYHWKAQIGKKKNTEYLRCILSVTAPTKLIMLACCPTCVAKKFILAIIKSLSSSLKEARTNAYTFEQ